MDCIGMRRYGRGPRKVIGVHGWFGDERSFARLEESLDPTEFECAWLSLRGVGQSRTVEGEFTMDEIARDTVSAAEHLDWETYSLIGHSMGGKAATLAAALSPGCIDRVIGIAPVSVRAQSFPPAVWRTFDAASSDLVSRRKVIASSIGGMASQAWVDRLAESSALHASSDVTRAYLQSWAGDDVSAVVQGSTIPTLGIVGGQDSTITRESVSAEYAELLEDWRVVRVRGAGHYVLDEAPLRVGALIDEFLRNASVSGAGTV